MRATTGSSPDNPRYYMDYTGTGNTLNVPHPRVLQLVMDSLRYWVTEMHVDGFRFDLAPALARELHEVSKLSSFFDVIHQDPIISQVKLIAEPWDVGEGGYQVGNFPRALGRVEWQISRHRAQLLERRRRQDAATSRTGCAAARICTQSSGKTPTASINFVTSHDGFTLHDLVSLQRQAQRGERRGQPGRRQQQSLVELRPRRPDATTPESRRCARRHAAQFPGDAFAFARRADDLRRRRVSARTQRGNNNAYCQDNEISWLDWRRDAARATTDGVSPRS